MAGRVRRAWGPLQATITPEQEGREARDVAPWLRELPSPGSNPGLKGQARVHCPLVYVCKPRPPSASPPPPRR